MGFPKNPNTGIRLMMILIISSSILFVIFAPKVASLPSLARLLQMYGLPPGIFPENVNFFEVDLYGRIKIHLERPCYAEYENLVYFNKVVKANLSYGELVGVEGLVQKELFLWLPVKSIIVDDPNSGVIMIDIGVAHQQIALSVFDEPPVCTPFPSVLHGREDQDVETMKMIDDE